MKIINYYSFVSLDLISTLAVRGDRRLLREAGEGRRDCPLEREILRANRILWRRTWEAGE